MATLLFAAVALWGYMSLLFVLALLRGDNGVADIGYGGGFLVAIGAALLKSGGSLLNYALILFVLVWALRLMLRIYRKNRGKPEDFRYKAWREAWGKYFVLRSYLQIYMLQGAVIYIVSLPVLFAIIFPVPAYTLFVAIGACVWVLGFFFESVGDYQLDTFIRAPENKGRIMQSGLWKYSRHPNYFGESMMWWGIAIAASGLTAYPLAVFISPLLITYLLLFVSGVPMLEKRWQGNPEWEAYAAKTSVFIPLFPKT